MERKLILRKAILCWFLRGSLRQSSDGWHCVSAGYVVQCCYHN